MKFLENPSIKTIIEQVEDLTRKKVTFIENKALNTHAKVKSARKGMQEHLIIYNPQYKSQLSHLIAHECGHILRIFRNPPKKRLMPTHSRNCRRIFVTAIFDEIRTISSKINKDINPLIDLWLKGIVLQLTNYPEDINIETWIYNDYPDLRKDQEKSIESQFIQAKQTLTTSSIVEITPKIVFLASSVMNYVFFKHMGSLLATDYMEPFESLVGIKERGEELINLTEKHRSNENAANFPMIDRWAEFFGIEKWFNWDDFENIPGNYLDI